jgi:hypothetical protein
MAYETWIGPIYLSAWAGKLGVPTEQLPWLTALPLLGSVGQLLGFVALSSAARRLPIKWLCITLAILARSLWALALLAPITELSNTVGRVGLIAALSATIGLTSTSFWMAWMNGIVPKRFDGRFWGARARGSTLGVLAAHGIAALVLNRLDAGINGSAEMISKPFAIILGLALLAALGSSVMLMAVPAPRKSHSTRRPTLGLLLKPELLSILLVGAAFQASISIAGPYFPYYFTHEVGLSSSEVVFWYAMTQAGISVAALFWGKRWDLAFAGRHRPPSQLFMFCGAMIAFSPLPYVIRDPALLHWIGPPEYFINGLAWAGFSVGLNTLLFRAIPNRDAGLTALLFSALTALQGVAGAAAAALGSKIALWLAPWGGFRALWVVSTSFRLLVALVLLPRLVHHRAWTQPPSYFAADPL